MAEGDGPAVPVHDLLVEAEAAGPGATLPVAIQVTESLPRRLGFAAEISSLDGLSAQAFWLHRNLLGGAERLRVEAEAAWGAGPLPLHVFRLAGIYGPGRGPFEKVRRGTARRVVKAGQWFSRIHVDDIAQVLLASIERPRPGAVYNVCDDDPAPPQDVIAHAAALLGLPPPPEVAFADAEMTPMARSFYAESKRVSNARIKRELGIRLIHPDYRSGLAAILAGDSVRA